MPLTLRDRERGFETKFAHDEELRFLILARRDKLVARWAATQAGLSEEATDTLVAAAVAIPNGPGHEQALRRLIAEQLRDRPDWTDARLSVALERCMRQARAQLTESRGPSGAA